MSQDTFFCPGTLFSVRGHFFMSGDTFLCLGTFFCVPRHKTGFDPWKRFFVLAGCMRTRPCFLDFRTFFFDQHFREKKSQKTSQFPDFSLEFFSQKKTFVRKSNETFSKKIFLRKFFQTNFSKLKIKKQSCQFFCVCKVDIS